MANLISRSPEICVCPEAEILFKLLLTEPDKLLSACMIKNYVQILKSDSKFRLWKISIDKLFLKNKTNLENFFQILENFQKQNYKDAHIIAFKHNYLFKLARYDFKENQVLFFNILRDPRSIFASQKITVSPNTGNPMCKNALSFSDSWNKYNQKINNLESNNAKTIYFEDLTAHTDLVMNDIFEFAGCNNKWESVKGNQNELSKWISDEYKLIHRNIDECPKPEVSEKWKRVLKKREMAILVHHIQTIDNYNIGTDNEYKWIFRLYELFLRIARKISYYRGIIQDKKFKITINRSC
jgi:hypothetical protein